MEDKKKNIISINFKPEEVELFNAFHEYLKNHKTYRGNITSLGVELIREALEAKLKKEALESQGK